MKKNPRSIWKRALRTALFPCLLTGCLLAGCGSAPEKTPEAAPKAAEKPVIGMLVYNTSDLYVSLVARAVQAALPDTVECRLLDAGNNQTVQNEQLDALLADNLGGLVINLVDTSVAPHVVERARSAGVPVVFFNREPDLEGVQVRDDVCFVGTVPLDAGKMQGDIISRLWSDHPEYDRNFDGDFQYIMLQANTYNPDALARSEYSVRQARDLGVPLRQVGDALLCNWNEEEAYQAMKRALAEHMDAIELVICNNDAMALGAIRALQEAGCNREGGPEALFVPVIGVDAVPQAIEAINRKTMSGTVKQDSDLMGSTVAAFILNAVNGKDFLEGTGLRWDEKGMGVAIPYVPYEAGK